MNKIKKWLIQLGLIKCDIHDWQIDALATKFGKKAVYDCSICGEVMEKDLSDSSQCPTLAECAEWDLNKSTLAGDLIEGNYIDWGDAFKDCHNASEAVNNLDLSEWDINKLTTEQGE